MGDDRLLFARVRSTLADTLICFPTPCERCRSTISLAFLPTFLDGVRKNPGPGGAGSVIVQLRIQTHAASVLWVASMAYGSAKTTNNVAETGGSCTGFDKQRYGLRQAKVSGYSPLHVVGQCACAIATHPPHKPHLALLFREARVIADDIGVSSWGHHYRTYNKMADHLANIAMDTEASIQVHAFAEAGVVKEATAFLDNEVNHWLEASHAKCHEPHGAAMTPRNLVISRQDFARRRTAVRELVYLVLNVEVATVTLLPIDKIYWVVAYLHLLTQSLPVDQG